MILSENKAKLFVVSAPSGCGKGTILHEVFKDRKVYYSVSYTTREPREGEEDGVNYFFVNRKRFEQMIDGRDFLEYARFVDNYYGTPKEPVFRNLANGIDVVLEIETNGAFQIKKSFPDAVLVFILPPTVKELERRLKKRGTEQDDVIKKRTGEARREIKNAYHYDYVILNDALEDAVEDFVTVMNSAKAEDDTAQHFRADDDEGVKLIEKVIGNA